MNDKELLIAAAKAADIKVTEWVTPSDGWFRREGISYSDEDDGQVFWNPLTDDGDALRLSVKLRIKYERHINQPYVAAWAQGIAGRFEEPEQPDLYAATRRAILRAAAEIGLHKSTSKRKPP